MLGKTLVIASSTFALPSCLCLSWSCQPWSFTPSFQRGLSYLWPSASRK